LKPVLISGDGFWNGFHVLLKDNVHIVIAIENNGIIVAGAFFAFFKHTEQGESAMI
jgi:hypothetical protein